MNEKYEHLENKKIIENFMTVIIPKYGFDGLSKKFILIYLREIYF